MGKHKTSTLQDVEAGREIETDALLGAVLELAQLTATPAPACQAVYALLTGLAHTMAEEQAGVRLAKVAA